MSDTGASATPKWDQTVVAGSSTEEKSPPSRKPKRRKVSRDEAWRRVEETRALLRVMMSDSEIKRTLAKSWNVKPRLVEWYIARARKTNRAVVEIDENQALADAVNYWGKRLQKAEIKMQRAERAREKEHAKLDRLDARIEALESTDRRSMSPIQLNFNREELAVLVAQRKTSSEMLKNIGQDEMRASMESRDAREHVDRIMGARHPIRIARVNSDGTDVKSMTPGEILEGLRLLGYGLQPATLPTFDRPDQRAEPRIDQHIGHVDQLVVVSGQSGQFGTGSLGAGMEIPMTLPGGQVTDRGISQPTPAGVDLVTGERIQAKRFPASEMKADRAMDQCADRIVVESVAVIPGNQEPKHAAIK